jgi:tetrahydromethanopterin S-methyltransferase subunit A
MTDIIKLKTKVDNIFGICCYHLLPIKQEYFIGKGRIIAICTLSNLDLLKEITNNQEIMDKISIVGRLLSENKGIDEIIIDPRKW